jgi:hypothetical protein
VDGVGVAVETARHSNCISPGREGGLKSPLTGPKPSDTLVVSLWSSSNLPPNKIHNPRRIEGYGVANPISEVLDRLKIELLV